MLFGMTDTKEAPVLFTPWSTVHFLSGMGATALFAVFINNEKLVVVITNILHILYELFDFLGDNAPWFKPFHDSIYRIAKVPEDKQYLWSNSLLNSVGDLISFALGQLVVLKYFNHIKIPVVVVVAILIFVIFTNATLMTLD